jgi:crotonobetainyl-CoA:carnitine CoA-transferase CaiB-like acyl-CoA transferase
VGEDERPVINREEGMTLSFSRGQRAKWQNAAEPPLAHRQQKPPGLAAQGVFALRGSLAVPTAYAHAMAEATSSEMGESPHTMAESHPRVAPGLGEHTDQVLRDLGFSSDQIAGLHASGAIPGTRKPGAAA